MRLVVKILVDAVDIRLDRSLDNVNRYAAAGDELVAAAHADLDDRFALCVLTVGQCAQRVILELDILADDLVDGLEGCVDRAVVEVMVLPELMTKRSRM